MADATRVRQMKGKISVEEHKKQVEKFYKDSEDYQAEIAKRINEIKTQPGP